MDRNICNSAAAVLFILFGAATTFSQTPVKPSGSGTSGDPYLIGTLDNLAWVQDPANNSAWGSYFKQTANIDASPTSGWSSGAGFSPIGNSSTNFTGTYDGQGYTISGLYISLGGSSSYVGMFGFCSGATIKKLGLISETVRGNTAVGGLVGLSIIGTSPSVIDSCYTTGSIVTVSGSGSELYIGGLVGQNHQATISHSYSSANVSTADGNGNFIGGLVGMNTTSASINSCYSTGSVSCNAYAQYVGGLVGQNYAGSTVSDSYSTGSVTGYSNVGGLAGGNVGSQGSCLISNCYSSGRVTGRANYGGLVGALSAASVDNSFWDTQTSGQSGSDGGTGETTADMKIQSTFTNAGWDFANTWAINSGINNGYPYLISVKGF